MLDIRIYRIYTLLILVRKGIRRKANYATRKASETAPFLFLAGPAEACSRSTAQISPARKSSLREAARSRTLRITRRTLPARIFKMLLKHASSPAKNPFTRNLAMCIFGVDKYIDRGKIEVITRIAMYYNHNSRDSL